MQLHTSRISLATNSKILDLGESKALCQAFYQIQDRADEKGIIPSLSDAYTKALGFQPSSCAHSVDKNLYNFRFIEAIARAMPAAKIIHCRRHPLDNILSMLAAPQAGNGYTTNPLDAASFLIRRENNEKFQTQP